MTFVQYRHQYKIEEVHNYIVRNVFKKMLSGGRILFALYTALLAYECL